MAFDVPFQRIVLPAARALELATAEGWRTDSPLQGKTVLIGGDYANDEAYRAQAITVVSAVLGVYLVIKSVIGLVKQG